MACSGGADSSALAIALRSVNSSRSNLVIAHVRHDLRSPSEVASDAHQAEHLADRLGLPYVEADVEVLRRPGNAEANARDARYESLASLAKNHACRFVATGHHADDQLESLLMALLRGAGVAGLRGVAPARPLDETTRLIRPMLDLDRADAERICQSAGWAWAEDESNRDVGRLRAALREHVTPVLRTLRPSAPHRAAATARVMREVQQVLSMHARIATDCARLGDAPTWSRAALREMPPALVAETLRAAVAERVAARFAGQDRLPERLLRPAVEAIRSASGETRSFDWACGTLLVERDTVTLRFRDPTSRDEVDHGEQSGQIDRDQHG